MGGNSGGGGKAGRGGGGGGGPSQLTDEYNYSAFRHELDEMESGKSYADANDARRAYIPGIGYNARPSKKSTTSTPPASQFNKGRKPGDIVAGAHGKRYRVNKYGMLDPI